MADNPNIVFAQAVLFADPAGANIEFGELQDCSFEGRDTTVQAYGPSSIYPLADELQRREWSLRASWLKVTAKSLKQVLGGSAAYDGGTGKTTLSITKSSIPSSFKAVLKTPSDGSDLQLVLYKVKPMNLTLPFALRDFTIPNFEARILVSEADSNKVCDIILPGNQA